MKEPIKKVIKGAGFSLLYATPFANMIYNEVKYKSSPSGFGITLLLTVYSGAVLGEVINKFSLIEKLVS